MPKILCAVTTEPHDVLIRSAMFYQVFLPQADRSDLHAYGTARLNQYQGVNPQYQLLDSFVEPIATHTPDARDHPDEESWDPSES